MVNFMSYFITIFKKMACPMAQLAPGGQAAEAPEQRGQRAVRGEEGLPLLPPPSASAEISAVLPALTQRERSLLGTTGRRGGPVRGTRGTEPCCGESARNGRLSVAGVQLESWNLSL